MLLSFASGGSWTAAVAGGQSCATLVCPPCPGDAELADGHQQLHIAGSSTELKECPPPPDCPVAEPAECPPCPACPAAALCPRPAAAAAAAAAADPPAAATAGLLCGGPDAIPSVADALDGSTQAILAAVNDSFAQWAESGFTLEDLLASADVVGAVGSHDTFVWIEVSVTDVEGVGPRSAGARHGCC